MITLQLSHLLYICIYALTDKVQSSSSSSSDSCQPDSQPSSSSSAVEDSVVSPSEDSDGVPPRATPGPLLHTPLLSKTVTLKSGG